VPSVPSARSTEPGNNQSVERAAAVLGAFASGRSPLRVSDVARHAGLGQSTASRMLATLESVDFVERDEESGLYQLGPMLITLAGVLINQHPVHREGRQRAQDLAHALELGVNIAVRKNASLFYICNFEGRDAPKSHTLMGQGNPLHATGLGKCLLLGLSPEERRQLLPENLQTFTTHTISSHQDLDSELDIVRGRWYATEVEELALGRACVAAPILGPAGTVVAALSISGPLSALDLDRREEQLASAAIETADSISGGLGYLGPTHDAAVNLASEFS
jgi:DNA-binding IclR family transcriptional regulator